MFKDYKYSVISKTYTTSFFRFLLLSTSIARLSKGTFCHVEVHVSFVRKGYIQTKPNLPLMPIYATTIVSLFDNL